MSQSSVLFPLYIYPDPDAWSPLYRSIQQYPNIHFTVVVNPGNGPGPDTLPDANYLRELPKLMSYANVDVVGYVHVTYTRRILSEVLHDMETYLKWTQQDPQHYLKIDGFFIDETPNQYDSGAEEYLRNLSQYAKSCGAKKIIHNPGCVASPAYMALADVTVIFEDTLLTFRSRLLDGAFQVARSKDEIITSTLTELTMKRSNLAMLVHSVPADSSDFQMQDLVREAKVLVDHLFLTELDVQYYSRFSGKWSAWVSLIGQ